MTLTTAATATPAARLESFNAAARRRVAEGAYRREGEALRPNGSLAAAVARGRAIVAELKPASPSEGRLLHGPAGPLLEAYRDGGADALSVLTDADHFGGSPALLREAHVTGLPTLMKDFVVDETQLDCAAQSGASAVLLIERLLGAERREALVRAAQDRGLEVLLEVFDAADWQAARASRADLVGVNARDLETLRVDRAGALVLLGQVAHERPGQAMALSGIHERGGARLAFAAGAGGVLVGTAPMRSPTPALLLRSLRRPLAKVCGLRSDDDVRVAAEAGADLVGLVVLSPGSPRDLAPADAARLADAARRSGPRPVLVTRCPDLEAVLAACGVVRPDLVQVHAPVTAGFVDAARRLAVGVLAGLGPGAGLPEAAIAGAVLDGDAAGGRGRAHDAASAQATVEALPGRLSLVAGGLDAATAPDAVRASGAWGADASGGLESAPGRKDPAKVAAFVQAVHGA